MGFWSLWTQFTDICVEKIHELGEYGLIWTDEDGFLLKPLGKFSIYFIKKMMIQIYTGLLVQAYAIQIEV